jgi:hypothetical protein
MAFYNIKIYEIGRELADSECVKFKCDINGDYAYISFNLLGCDDKELSIHRDVSLLGLGLMRFPEENLRYAMNEMIIALKRKNLR